MARTTDPRASAPNPQPPRRPATSGWSQGVLTALLIAVGASIVLAGMSLREVRKVRNELGPKLVQLDSKLGQILQGQAAAGQRPPQQRASGPDANAVHTISVDGAPAKGPATAPIVIAEFSDFQ